MYALNWSNSIVVLLVGMSIVFSFLVILVLTVRLMSVIVMKLGLDKEPVATTASGGNVKKGNLVAVISAAIKKYEEDKKA